MESQATAMKRTQPGQNYWENTAAYSKEMDELWEAMVPASGPAKTLNGELVRAVSRLIRDYYNNGNFNAAQLRYEYGDSYDEDVVTDASIAPLYEKFIRLIEESIPAAQYLTECLRETICITAMEGPTFSQTEEMVYNQLGDEVVYYVLTHEDKPLPKWYEEKRW